MRVSAAQTKPLCSESTGETVARAERYLSPARTGGGRAGRVPRVRGVALLGGAPGIYFSVQARGGRSLGGRFVAIEYVIPTCARVPGHVGRRSVVKTSPRPTDLSGVTSAGRAEGDRLAMGCGACVLGSRYGGAR